MSTRKKHNHKKSTRYKQKESAAQREKRELFMAIPLSLIAGIVPVIVFIREMVLNDPGNMYWDGRNTHYDIFSYYKMVFFLIFTCVGVLTYMYLNRENPFDKPRRNYYIPLGVFSLFAIISAIFSEYKPVAFFGIVERYEGVFVLVAYAIVAFLSMNVFKKEKQIKILFGCLLSSAAIISIIGLFQYFNKDIFETKFILNLISPPSLKGSGSLTTKFDNVYSTLFNPNYVGSYMAMIIPVIVVLIFWAKKFSYKIALSVLLALSAITLIGCDSRAGLLGTAIAFIVLIVIYRRKLIEHKRITISIAILAVAGITIFNFATHGSIVNRIERMLTLGLKEDDGAMLELHEKLAGLNDIKMDNEKAQILTDKGTLLITHKDGRVDVMDENGEPLASELNNDTVNINDERFSNIRLRIKPEEAIMLIYYNDYELMNIVFTKEGLRSTSNRWLAYRNDREIETFGFKGIETLGSNRGYIWSRSLPQLKDTIIIGKGPDTFALYFPQYDFLGKLKYYITGNMYVDKPHNMYLQAALNTGVLSLLAILALFGIYVVSSIKVYWKADFKSFLPVAGTACFAAFFGYAIAGIMNDSTISVAPVFWVLLGMGMGINLILQGERR